MTLSLKYKVHTFEGPLDLLLELIEEKKLTISEIALADVTEQFLAYLKTLEDVRPEILADFLIVAGKLLVIKSRSLLPSIELGEEDHELETDLAEQLMLLKKIRGTAKSLSILDDKKCQSFAREPFWGERVVFYPDPSLNTFLLRDAASNLAVTIREMAKIPQVSVTKAISISEKIEHLQNKISQKVQVALKDLLEESGNKTEAIVTFLALLELVKQKMLLVEQEGLFAEIMIKRSHNK